MGYADTDMKRHAHMGGLGKRVFRESGAGRLYSRKRNKAWRILCVFNVLSENLPTYACNSQSPRF